MKNLTWLVTLGLHAARAALEFDSDCWCSAIYESTQDETAQCHTCLLKAFVAAVTEGG